MSKVCYVCGKKPHSGYNVSHSHNRTKRRWMPNLQRLKVVIDGANRRVRVCTSCISKGKVKKAG